MKKILTIMMALIILTTISYADSDGEHGDFSEALDIIENKISCDDLTDDEFELLGDYYMELMHPGEAHVRMDAMMGGEGSESLKLMHINMGKRFYCDGEDYTVGSGMMMGGMGNMMNNPSSQGFSMMSFPGTTTIMGNYGVGYFINLLLMIVIFVLFIMAIIWLYKNTFTKKEKPMNILKNRLAEGKITKKEYDELKKELR